MDKHLFEEDMSTGEYISKEALLKRLDMASDCKNCPRCVDMKTYYDRCAYTDIQDVCSVISDMSVANVQSVKHGRWDGYICSECNVCADYFISGDFYFDEKPNFCPNCGARMDGDTNE